jgi:alginate O-acetyltransferase complex protein AlgI
MEAWCAEFVRRFPSGDFYVSLPFWGAFAVVVLLYRLAPRRPALKEWLLLVCSVCMLLTLPRFTLTMLAVLFTVCVATYSCGKLLLTPGRLTNPRRRRLLAAAAITANVLVLAFFKYAFVQDAILGLTRTSPSGADFIFLIGISYSSFRAMHFVIEAYRNEIKQLSLLTFLNYMLFFPAFISGPIHRFNHYCVNSAAARNAPLRSDLAAGLDRIVHGLFKKSVLTVVLFPYTLKNMGIPVQEMPVWQIVVGLYAFALYLYFDFSGYTDLAIGSARIMGFVLPENFNRPFLKENIQQLWANFHMSLTGWLTDYIYWPIVRKLRERDFFRKHPVFLSNLAIFITFMICGLWHGNTLIFLFWGMYQGAGLSAVNVYQKWKRKVRNPGIRKYFKSSLSYAVGVFLTFNFYSAGLLLFVLNTSEMMLLLGRLK